MLRSAVFVFGCCLVTVLASTPKERLLRDLLQDYDSNVDPGNIRLKVNIKLICATYDRRTRVVTSDVWEHHSWKDERLRWTPSEHGGVDSIRIPSKLIWTPDTVQYTSLAAVNDRDDNANAVLKSDGSVLWIPRAVYRTPCTGDSDITCVWRFGSWTYDGVNVVLAAEGDDPIDVSLYSSSCPLTVTSHKADIVSHTYPCCKEPYPSLDATIVFRPVAGYNEQCEKC